ncbi:MAG: hypothetical protein PHN82_03515 [bacterium]|nr:hypothetical protein [bacterium]
MGLEERVIGIEREAEAIIDRARREARILLGTIDERRKAAREEIAAAAAAAAARLRDERAARAREEIASIGRERERGLAAIERAREERAGRCAGAIARDLLEEGDRGD